MTCEVCGYRLRCLPHARPHRGWWHNDGIPLLTVVVHCSECGWRQTAHQTFALTSGNTLPLTR